MRFFLLATLCASPAFGQDISKAVGAEAFYSTDSDGTEVQRVAINFDLRHVRHDDYLGVSVEKARYQTGGDQREYERIFARAAGGEEWQWLVRIGTDGRSIVGAASVHDNSRYRKEFFIERDIIGTREGLEQRRYTTFVGSAVDIPIDDRNVVTALVGIQEFGGSNIRLHARGNYVHVVKPDWGLSAQLRTRYFRNSQPRELDYYSPRWFAEVIPVGQVRRFVGGWELVGAGGLGARRDSDSNWSEARYAHARFRSPTRHKWLVTGNFTYTNAPALNKPLGEGYSYTQFSLGVTRVF
jgi:hypothetical protein